jgi:hypothetical protein
MSTGRCQIKNPSPLIKTGGADIIKGCGEGLLYTLDFSAWTSVQITYFAPRIRMEVLWLIRLDSATPTIGDSCTLARSRQACSLVPPSQGEVTHRKDYKPFQKNSGQLIKKNRSIGKQNVNPALLLLPLWENYSAVKDSTRTPTEIKG